MTRSGFCTDDTGFTGEADTLAGKCKVSHSVLRKDYLGSRFSCSFKINDSVRLRSRLKENQRLERDVKSRKCRRRRE